MEKSQILVPMALAAGPGIAGYLARKGAANLIYNDEWTTPLKPKAGLAELVSNKPPINIPTVKDLVTDKSVKIIIPKVENQVVTPKVTANPSGSGTGKKSTPMKKYSGVMDIQKTINAETGANLVVDGKWGPKTEAAYKTYLDKINDSKNSAQSAQNTQSAQLPTEGLAATVAPKEVGFLEGLSQFWEKLFQDDRTPEQKEAELQAEVDKILGGPSGNTGLAAAQYGR